MATHFNSRITSDHAARSEIALIEDKAEPKLRFI